MFYEKRTHLPATANDDVKRLESFETTWQIEGISSDHVLIPSNIRGHPKLEFVVGSDSIVTLTHSLTQTDNTVAYARGSKLQKNCVGKSRICFENNENEIFSDEPFIKTTSKTSILL